MGLCCNIQDEEYILIGESAYPIIFPVQVVKFLFHVQIHTPLSSIYYFNDQNKSLSFHTYKMAKTMIENLPELQNVLLYLHLRKQEYIEEIERNNVSSIERRFLIPNERMLDNIEKLIIIVSAEIRSENANVFPLDCIISLIHNYRKPQNIASAVSDPQGIQGRAWSGI